MLMPRNPPPAQPNVEQQHRATASLAGRRRGARASSVCSPTPGNGGIQPPTVGMVSLWLFGCCSGRQVGLEEPMPSGRRALRSIVCGVGVRRRRSGSAGPCRCCLGPPVRCHDPDVRKEVAGAVHADPKGPVGTAAPSVPGGRLSTVRRYCVLAVIGDGVDHAGDVEAPAASACAGLRVLHRSGWSLLVHGRRERRTCRALLAQPPAAVFEVGTVRCSATPPRSADAPRRRTRGRVAPGCRPRSRGRRRACSTGPSSGRTAGTTR
jgi:hypothetical protein